MKNHKKIIIICIICIIMAVGLGISLYFLHQYKELKKPIKESWGQKYYIYLKDVNENKKQEEAGLPENLKESELSFYEVENVSEPVMVINYEKDNQDYSNVYYISNDKVNVLAYNQPSTIELLYNIENKKYDYYSHVVDNKTNKYKTIAEQINERIRELEKSKQNNAGDSQKVEESTEYTFSDETVDKVVDVNGKEIVLNKFDETFVKPDIKTKTIKYDTTLKEKELKEKITKQVEDYKPVEKVVTKNIENQVEKKVEEVKKIEQEMTKAKEEVAKKEAEEKARKEAEEREKALKQGLKVGTHTLKYGTYKYDLGFDPNGGLYGTIELKPNNMFHIKTNFDQSGGNKIPEMDCDGTYSIKLNQPEGSPGIYADFVVFKPNCGSVIYLEVSKDNSLSDQWHGYSYTGN